MEPVRDARERRNPHGPFKNAGEAVASISNDFLKEHGYNRSGSERGRPCRQEIRRLAPRDRSAGVEFPSNEGYIE